MTEHGNNSGVNGGPHHVTLQGTVGTRTLIPEDDGSETDEHPSQVSSTWREPFAPPFHRMHLENGTSGKKEDQDSDDLNGAHMVEEKKLIEHLYSSYELSIHFSLSYFSHLHLIKLLK